MVNEGNTGSNIRNVIPSDGGKAAGSIAHAADVLTCLSNDVHTVTEIARRCGLGKSTVHRVLKLLKHPGLVVQDAASRHYYLGPLVTRLASNPITTHEYLIMCAGEEMDRLARLSKETVALDIMIGTHIFPLYEIPSQHNFRVTQESRASGPVNAGASGKALLSLLNEKQLRNALAGTRPVRVTDRTVTDPDLLTAQVRETACRGYAVSRGERIDGVMCISAPVKNYSLPVVLSIVGPESRLSQQAPQAIAQILISAERISRSAAGIVNKPVK